MLLLLLLLLLLQPSTVGGGAPLLDALSAGLVLQHRARGLVIAETRPGDHEAGVPGPGAREDGGGHQGAVLKPHGEHLVRTGKICGASPSSSESQNVDIFIFTL